MEAFFNEATSNITSFAGKLLFAALVLLVGSFVIRRGMRLLEKKFAKNKMDAMVKKFAFSFLRVALYVLLIISVVGILGVPLASVIAVLASAGAAIGLALQGALANFAGGIMLMVFKPFKIGDYIEAAGAAGTVQEVMLFYTVLITPDNKRITIPNGALMNANIVDYSAEDTRRVDLAFTCARSESAERVREVILAAAAECGDILTEPEPPFAMVGDCTNDALGFTVRVWCKTEKYWDVYFDLKQRITNALAANGIRNPEVRIISDGK